MEKRQCPYCKGPCTKNGRQRGKQCYKCKKCLKTFQLQFFDHPEGYVAPNGSGGYDYVYQYKDHLGNVRLSYTEDPSNPGTPTIIEENNYYPFGLEHKGYNGNVSPFANSTAEKFKYNGVELEESLGLELYEMPLRNYDPAIGRFITADPVVHHSLSPYNAFDNNPVFFADPSGADAWDFNSTVGADGLTNQQWLDLTRPSFDGSRSFDDQRDVARQNFQDEVARNRAASVEVGEGVFEDQETREKAIAFLTDIIDFFLVYASYNAEIQYRRDNGLGHLSNVNYTEKEKLLSDFYSVNNSTSEGYKLSDGLTGFKFNFDLSIDKQDFGNVFLQYRGGNRINGFSTLDRTTASLNDNSKIGDAILFNHTSRNVPVGLMIFDSKILRQNFIENFYSSRFNRFLTALQNGKKIPIDKN
ncbi:MAG: RHS repeat-associated core domain-containing protein [Bacteroidota bacterium]